MLLRTVDKFEAAEAWVKMWLKDNRKKCFNCNLPYDYESFMSVGGCCDMPLIGTNAQMLTMHKKEVEKMKFTRMNEYGSNSDKSMRMQLSIPTDLYMFLDTMFKKNYEEKLFNNESEKISFMKRFNKIFTIPEVI